MAGYSGTALPRKLGISEGAIVALRAAPDGFERTLGELPDGVRTRRIGALRCFFNYNPLPVQLRGLEGLDILVGSADLPPAGVLIGREKRLDK